MGKKKSLEEIKFEEAFKKWSNKWNIIGSDETGKGEIFKELITAAVYVKKSGVPELEGMGVNDSKKLSDKKLKEIAEKLTGQKSYDYFKDNQLKVLKSPEADVLYVISILPNRDYEEAYEKVKKKGGSQWDIIREEHVKVLNMLMEYVDKQRNNGNEECYHYVVIDDFQDGRQHDKIIEMLGNGDDTGNMEEETVVMGNINNIEPSGEKKKVIIQKEMDGKTLAAGCASIISYYIQECYLEKINTEVREKYGLPAEFQFPTSGNYTDVNFYKFKTDLDKADEELKKRDGSTFNEILKEYGKQSYLRDVVWDSELKKFIKLKR